LDTISESWIKAAEVRPENAWIRPSAEELAVEFCRALYARPVLIGGQLRSTWVKQHYPVLCRAFGIASPPAYKDFANELALLLPRKRVDRRERNGKRMTSTWYRIRRI
jgi:hypothetical protein